MFAEKAKENKIRSGGEYGRGKVLHNCVKPIEPINTTKEIAKIANVSHGTIARVEKIKQHAKPEIIEKLKTGEVSINQVYQQVQKDESKKRKSEELFQTQQELKSR